jgi:LmbE family N-acetylglucosaminyl deacetylase
MQDAGRARAPEEGGGYAHVYLSPHMDDAALSCGGAIARFTAAGQRVLVVNVCSGSPPPGGPLSPFAALQHERWGLPPDQAVARRLAEDAEALAILGADGLELGLLDAIYRLPGAYVDDATLFGPVARGDTLAADAGPALETLAARLPGAVFYAPLGVGNHVDHVAVHAVAGRLAASGATVAYYEDFPYAARAEGAVEARLDKLGGADRFGPAVAPIDAVIERKLAAVAAYASQLATLFGGREQMERAVADYALRVGGGSLAERVWVRV